MHKTSHVKAHAMVWPSVAYHIKWPKRLLSLAQNTFSMFKKKNRMDIVICSEYPLDLPNMLFKYSYSLLSVLI